VQIPGDAPLPTYNSALPHLANRDAAWQVIPQPMELSVRGAGAPVLDEKAAQMIAEAADLYVQRFGSITR
jgi:hypothetical protein